MLRRLHEAPSYLELSFMKKAQVALMLLAASLSAVAVGEPAHWAVVSSAPIDARIKRQLRELALRQGASLKVAQPREGEHTSPNVLSVSLDQLEPSLFVSKLTDEAQQPGVPLSPVLVQDGYILRISYSASSSVKKIQIQAESPEGFHNAVLRMADVLTTTRSELTTKLFPAAQALRHEGDAEVVIADYPSFGIRGIIEGFYGPPWSHRDRLDMLRFEGQHSLNTYIYAPKDDPYHRKLWREPYPSKQMKRLRELIAAARDNFVHFTFAISPGLSMVYSSDVEFRTLTRKLESVAQLGVTDFALLLDDVPQELVHPEDRARFKTLAEAHSYLINRLYDHLKSLSPQNRLAVCPTTYTNEWGNRGYLRELGAGVNPEIPLEWTGTEVIPSTITAAQADEWGAYIRRKPLIWDNFPVNDNHPWRLILDPLRGRDAALATHVQGLFSNPMYQAHASMIPLQTVSDYLWNPTAYDPQESRAHALVSQYGADALSIFAPILDIYDDRGQEPVFAPIFEERRSLIDVPAIQSQLSLLNATIQRMKTQPGFQKLTPELEPIPAMLQAQLDRILLSSAFKHRPDGKIEWDRDRHRLMAAALANRPVIDGDFSKWQSDQIHLLHRASQLETGQEVWKGPEQFSAKVAFAWDKDDLYVAVDVIDPELYQPFEGRGIQHADAFRLIIDTSNDFTPGRPAGVYDLYFSPGNFATVGPSIFSDEDFFPPRSTPHDYKREIRTAWKKTVAGYSGEIVVPASFLGRKEFSSGGEIGLSFGVRKTLAQKDNSTEDLEEIVFTSKEDKLFSVDPENPATLQQLVLAGPEDPLSTPSALPGGAGEAGSGN
jgi:hypothetical protein